VSFFVLIPRILAIELKQFLKRIRKGTLSRGEPEVARLAMNAEKAPDSSESCTETEDDDDGETDKRPSEAVVSKGSGERKRKVI
jgi:hypothetical protein